MPNPLFPFTWQYNNQPIEVLAATISEFVTNPTSKVIPVCADTANAGAGEFVDSTLTDDGVSLRTIYTVSPGVQEDQGFKADYVGRKYNVGEFGLNYNGTTLSINDATGTTRFTSEFNGTAEYFGVDFDNEWLEATDGLTDTTAGSAAAKFLKVRVGSTTYKIQLLDA